MTVTAKICGLKTPETVQAAVDGGASHIGFNFFAKSPRYLEPDAAARLAPPARARNVKICAVMVDPDDGELDRVAAALRPDFIQLHGKETPARAHAVAARTGCEIIKVFSVSEAGDLAAAGAYEPVARLFMFDAKVPKDAAMPGGMGVRFDWTLLSGRRFARPWFLAGGLDPWNVGEAAKTAGAPMVDVSSGVERGPGLKDPALITAFLEAVRRA